MTIKEKFNDVSKMYDNQRKQLIPCFYDFYNLPLSVITYKGTSPKVLDIGSGTGLFSEILLKKYPNAKVTLIDLSDKMLDVAKKRFDNNPSFEFIVDDYTKHEFINKFDIIISALSIHHLSHIDKENLYKKCYNILEDNGVFINADQVLSPYNSTEKMFSDLWRDFVEKSGLSKSEISNAYERISFDNPSTLSDQLKWLTNAGFKTTDIIFKYYHFCTFYAQK
ncbi:MAG: class I SAM-dependent methyltransferase [Clostridium sp.]